MTINNTIFYNNYSFDGDYNAVTVGFGSDVTDGGRPLSISNAMLQTETTCTDCPSMTNKNPLFRNSTNPTLLDKLAGADNIWLTADDNLQLSCGGRAANTGKNSAVVGTTDAIGNPRIQFTIVDLGAYESAVDGPTVTTQPVETEK